MSTQYGTMVATARKEHGITQARLAELTESSLTFISMIERGCRSPSIIMKWRIFNAIGVEVVCPACGTMLKEDERT